MPRSPRRFSLGRGLLGEAAAVVLGSVLIVGALVALGGDSGNLGSDQQILNQLVLRELDPELFKRDLVLGRDHHRLYIPGFPQAQATIIRYRGGDPKAVLKFLLWPVGVLFLAGHYILFRSLTSSPVAAGLAAVSALTVRNSFGGDYWGFDGLQSVQPRIVGSALVPVLLLGFLRWRQSRWFSLYFALPGALVNLHPVAGLHLAQVVGLAFLWLERFRWRAWPSLAGSVACFAVGASPFLLAYLPTRDHLQDPALLPVVRAGLDYRFPYLLFPLGLETVVSIIFHAAFLLVVLAWLWRRRGLTDDLRTLLIAGATAVIVGIAGTALIQLHGVLTDRPYVDIQQLRAVRLAYPTLLAALALGYRRLLASRTRWSVVTLVIVFMLSLVPPATVIHSFSTEKRDMVKSVLGIPVSDRSVPLRQVDDPAALAALFAWVRTNTPPTARFLTDSLNFREETRRSITGSHKDGGVMWLAGTRPFYEWYRYVQAVDRCRERGGEGCWFDLAYQYDAAFAVVDPTLPRVGSPPDFEKVWERSGWSLWRRRSTSG